MAQFAVGKPITTDTPGIAVDAGLAVGRHRFRLEVLDAAGLRSRVADEVVVQVQRLVVPDRPIPTPVTPVTPVRPTPVVTPIVTPIVNPVRPVVTPVRTPNPRRPR
ncbi:hypothetical protein [Pseudorhodoferax sp. Leaf274]|uniref:hypothetical protein n=1 Tax=Pseudorhodoferax sp. Leaf274 TaxID=1736318 RepID=UPI0007033E84|nr:hypothetical protein [Pseudorhodoferax sp. Leaf274]KQP37382.1 hypothetical protein ASF44_13555 [Pseudorhodoferax sp. Leaf274]